MEDRVENLHNDHEVNPMSKNEMRPDAGPATRAIHLGYDPAEFQGALTPPLFMTSTYAFETAEQGTAIFAGEAEGLVYGRTKNPTQAPSSALRFVRIHSRIPTLSTTVAHFQTASTAGESYDIIARASGFISFIPIFIT